MICREAHEYYGYGCSYPKSTLPSEIMHMILDIVESQSWKETLGAIALCSHDMHKAVLPYLYRRISFDKFDAGLSHPAPSALWGEEPYAVQLRHLNRLRVLVITLHRRPEYAAFIRHLDTRRACEKWIDHNPISEVTVEYVRRRHKHQVPEAFVDAINKWTLSPLRRRRWLQSLSGAHDDGWLALMLPKLINLETLDLRLSLDPKCIINRILGDILRMKGVFCERQIFSRLRHIMLVHPGFCERDYFVRLQTACFYLPRLESVYGFGVAIEDELAEMAELGDETDDDGGKESMTSSHEALCDGVDRTTEAETLGASPKTSISAMEPGSSSVKVIELRNSHFNTALLEHFLRAPRTLETFIYEAKDVDRPWFRADHISVALAQQSASLTNLWLDYTQRTARWTRQLEWLQESEDNAPIGSLSQLIQLRRLRIATVFIFGTQTYLHPSEIRNNDTLTALLPTNIEELHFTHAQDNYDCLLMSLGNLLVKKAERIPNLKHIVIEAPFVKSERKVYKGMMLREREMTATRELIQTAENYGVRVRLMFNMEHDAFYDVDGGVQRTERRWGIDEDVMWAPIYEQFNDDRLNARWIWREACFPEDARVPFDDDDTRFADHRWKSRFVRITD